MISVYQLKPRFQNLLRPGVQRLYRRGITANQVTLAACLLSLLVGALVAGFASHLWLFAPRSAVDVPAHGAERGGRHARPRVRPEIRPGRLPQRNLPT
ncbi:CDP-alcohol phosphatidyltransferase [Pseudomonas aeruginosa]|nr:CDP-alcohol phosphatidyltransferase [Pseudomonas aeruginosa]